MNRVSLKNFRCFRDERTVRLAPLTLLVGENSTGKTSFLAMIRALWYLAYQNRAPDFKEDPYDLGSFDEIAHFRGARAGQAHCFEAGFVVAGRRGRGTPKASMRFDVTFENKANAPFPTKIRVADEGGDVWMEDNRQETNSWRFRFGTPNGSWSHDLSGWPFLYDGIPSYVFTLPTTIRAMQNRVKLTSESLYSPSSDDWERVENLCQNYSLVPQHSSLPVYASAPVRSKPRRTYNQTKLDRDSEGDNIPMYLAHMSSQNESGWSNLRGKIEEFGLMAGLFEDISVRSLGKKASDPFQVQIRKRGDKSKGPLRNLIDVGYGVSQVLPVVTELLRGEASLFLLQQPEVHLHPSAQAALGSLFCQVAGRRRQLVVETHSDHLLDRVRMDVRDGRGKLEPKDISILFFEHGNLDVRIHSLELDAEGNVLGAPPGYRDFFKAETRRSLGL